MSIKYYDKSGESPQEKLLAGISPVDAILSGTSKNAIQNKAVFNALKEKIEVTVDHLVYFYNKSEVYNKEEVRALIGAIDTLTMEVVSSLPVSDISTTTIYLLKPSGSSVYDEYVYINNAWVKIGTTDMDLSGYMTTAAFNLAIADYYTKAEIDAMIADYYTKDEIDDILENYDSGQFVGTTAEWNALPLADKVQYTTAIFTDDDDYVGNIVDAVTDGEMSAVTSNAVYDHCVDNIFATTEVKTNKIWYNGKPVYRKMWTGLDFGNTPDAWTTITGVSSSDLSGIEDIVGFIARRPSDNTVDNVLLIRTNSDKTALMYYSLLGTLHLATLVLEYTKTT